MPEFSGQLLFRLSRGSDGRCVLSTTSTRPVHTANLFRNKSCRTTLALVPRLYSLCALAQGVAAITVTETALGAGSDTEARLQREVLVAIETIREHLWRKLVHWRELFGVDADISRFQALYASANILFNSINPGYRLMADPAAGAVINLRSIRREFQDFYSQAEASLGDIQPLLERKPGEQHPAFTCLLARKWDRLGDGCERPLGDLSFAELSARLAQRDANDFIAAPEWDGLPHETGPFSRMLQDPAFNAWTSVYGTGLYSRCLRRYWKPGCSWIGCSPPLMTINPILNFHMACQQLGDRMTAVHCALLSQRGDVCYTGLNCIVTPSLIIRLLHRLSGIFTPGDASHRWLGDCFLMTQT